LDGQNYGKGEPKLPIKNRVAKIEDLAKIGNQNFN